MTPRLVVTLVPPRVHLFELGVACEVFGIDRRDLVPNWYRFKLIAEESTVPSASGIDLHNLAPLSWMNRAHTVILVGAEGPRTPSAALISALQSAAKRGTRLVSICGGAFTLGHAGLLDGHVATTHWKFCDLFQRTFPKVVVDSRPLFVSAGNIWTSAGNAAGIDACLALVREDFGAAVANQVARRMVAPPHREGGQAQFVETPVPANNGLQEVMEWTVRRLGERLTVRDMAKKAAMSGRTFARRFVALTGTTPHSWLTQQRVARAQLRLETTDLPIDKIAAEVGLDGTTLRSRFKRSVGTSPKSYQLTFRAKASG